MKYLYKDQTIEYSGFKMGDLYCFYANGIMIYLNEYKVKNQLIKL